MTKRPKIKRRVERKSTGRIILSRVSTYYKNSFLFSLVGYLRRKIKSRNLNNSKRRVFNMKGLFKHRIIILVVVSVAFLIFFIFNLITYLSISPTFYDFAELENLRSLDGEEYNVLFLGYNNYDKTNSFLDFIILLSINSKSSVARAYGVNPNYVVKSETTNQSFTLKVLTNNLSTDNKIQVVSNHISSLLGIRIDRNVTFNIDDLEDLIVDWGISSKLVREDLTVGNTQEGQDFVDYLNSIQNSDQKTKQYLQFFTQNIESNRGFTAYYKYFLNNEKLSKIFKTNMNRKELIDFSKALYSIEGNIRNDFLSTKMGYKVNTGVEEGFNPDIIILNESIYNIFSDVRILAEQAKIEVYNATTTSGFATKKRRIYQNLGGNVVKFGNYSELNSKTIIYVLDTKISNVENTLDMIVRDIGQDVEIKTEGYDNNYTGQIIVVLGEDLVSDAD